MSAASIVVAPRLLPLFAVLEQMDGGRLAGPADAIVIPRAPGGSSDILTRLLGADLSRPLVIEAAHITGE
ncbi:MAG: hypothetical protein H7125_04460 [Proteobacteria bacterium]|nr:hypothetical protein [Burkholderiales bacterium]